MVKGRKSTKNLCFRQRKSEKEVRNWDYAWESGAEGRKDKGKSSVECRGEKR